MRGTTLADCLHSRHRISFQLTCPMRGTTDKDYVISGVYVISTHVPHAGHDCELYRRAYAAENFNSRAPCGARPLAFSLSFATSTRFQLTCPMRGTTEMPRRSFRADTISTHVPHAGHDRSVGDLVAIAYISTHVPHAGHDHKLFGDDHGTEYFNSRAPCGARR